MERKVTAVIPARAGSKGIKNKNIMDFCGKPLIAWSIEQAQQAKCVDEVYVSTDGEEIAEISKKYGARIIWRPEELSTDTASSESAILHAVTEIKGKHEAGDILFLQATSPVRLTEDIENAVETFFDGAYDSLFSMSLLEDFCIWKQGENGLQSFTYDYQNRGRRQDRPPLFLENGSIYVFKSEILFRLQTRIGGKIGMYQMPFDRSFEIDSINDVEICSFFMRKYYN